ncbi:ribokinase [Sinanaerobacter sp. ZZT-01]|uniref:ribokinase n=1 Tax=Sinanaerobacter sp. ZZT-01 TaxID=3111540 RepID=UPI002D777EE0|nr:ribokinase [Sinanaerobacter sp. ZZT-01]WRR95052.1 ribokinase [Sinanaerobacter sp. ZZT-01]
MITVIGSLNMDLVINTPRLPKPGETIMGRKFKQVPGGKGANQAAAIARLGADVQMIGCIGEDQMGQVLKQTLEKDGVNTKHIFEKKDSSTGVAAILVEEFGNNMITVAPGANYALSVDDIKDKKAVIQDTDIVLLQLETTMDVVETALTLAKEAGKKTILNPAPAWSLRRAVLKNIDVLTPNETELETLTGGRIDTEQKLIDASRVLIKNGVGEIVVTLGEKGCVHVTKDTAKRFHAYNVKSVDATAAGDSFNGALAVCLERGDCMDAAIEYAMKVGAMTVTKEGAQTSLPYKKEVDAFTEWLKKGEE